jgi:GMP synthase-like glutamine amidotransferase
MNIAVLQHEPFEGPALIADWAAERGHSLSIHHLYRGDSLPDLAATDWMVAMGGAMSVNDEAALPWLVEEKALVRRAVEENKRVLGVCLGAQLIASALGAQVFQNSEREIGWWPLQVLPGGGKYLRVPRPVVLHWHGETFDLPPNSTLLASSEGCANQAFSIGERVVGLQFHLECTRDTVAALVEECADELAPGQKWVQSAEQVLAGGDYTANRNLLWKLLDAMEAA